MAAQPDILDSPWLAFTLTARHQAQEAAQPLGSKSDAEVRKTAVHLSPPVRGSEIRGPASGTVIAEVTTAVSKKQYVDAKF